MKQPPPGTEEKIGKMTLAAIYPLYLSKVEKKGRTQAELNQLIEWLTGYDEARLKSLIADGTNFKTFFEHCELNKNVHLITGVVCGYRVEEIENPFIRKVRFLDKLVDELAKGKKMEKILRMDN